MNQTVSPRIIVNNTEAPMLIQFGSSNRSLTLRPRRDMPFGFNNVTFAIVEMQPGSSPRINDLLARGFLKEVRHPVIHGFPSASIAIVTADVIENMYTGVTSISPPVTKEMLEKRFPGMFQRETTDAAQVTSDEAEVKTDHAAGNQTPFEIRRCERWNKHAETYEPCQLPDIKKGDRFHMFEADGSAVVDEKNLSDFVATRDAYKNSEGVWTVNYDSTDQPPRNAKGSFVKPE